MISSILSHPQQECVEEFVKGQKGFSDFWNSLRSKKGTFGEIVDNDFSFKNGLLSCVFLFVKDILVVLGKVNTFLQHQNLNVLDAWCVVQSLRKYVLGLTQTIQHQPQSLTFLSGLEREQIGDFVSYLQQLVISLDIRFSFPSTSYDKRKKEMKQIAASFFDQPELNPFSHGCSISDTFGFLCFRDPMDGLRNVEIRQSAELAAEVERAREEIIQHHEFTVHSDKISSSITSQVGFKVTRTPSFQDAFLFIERGKYPLLWKEMVKLRTVMPTTVCCEQSFSVVKHALHCNMKNETVVAVVTTKYNAKEKENNE